MNENVNMAGGKVILIVEDDPRVRKITAQRLKALGFSVLEAKDGQQGLALFSSTQLIDLVIADLGVPGMNGWEMGQAIIATAPDARIIYTSGYADLENYGDGTLLPKNFLSKPYGLKELAARLETILSE